MSLVIGQGCTRQYGAPKSTGAMKKKLPAIQEAALNLYLSPCSMLICSSIIFKVSVTEF